MNQPQPPKPRSWGCLHVLLILIILLLAAILGSMWWIKRNAYAPAFTPVELNPESQLVLDAKLNAVDPSMGHFGAPASAYEGIYTEDDARRKITFTQDELNAVLAKDPDLATRLKFYLSDNLISLQFITPMDETVPLLGGKTFKFSMGIALAYTNNKPAVVIRGISIGGIPLPAAWWGNIKNQNLVDTFSEDGGFWDLFSRGVEHIEVADGRFILHLKE